MDGTSVFDLDSVLTGVVMAMVLVSLMRGTPSLRILGGWFALALACGAATGVVENLLGVDPPASVFLIAALHGLVPVLILLGLRSVGERRISSGLIILVIVVMLTWVGATTSAGFAVAWVVGPVHLVRGGVFLVCAWAAMQFGGRRGDLVATVAVLAGLLNLGLVVLAVLQPDMAELHRVDGVENALTLGVVLTAVWATVMPANGHWFSRAGPSAPDRSEDSFDPIDLVEQGVLRIGVEGRVTWANRHAHQVLAEGEDGLVGSAWTDLFPDLAARGDLVDALPRRGGGGTRHGDGDGDGGGADVDAWMVTVARTVQGHPAPVDLALPDTVPVALRRRGEVVVLLRGQWPIAHSQIGRTSIGIDRHVLGGDSVEEVCGTVAKGVAKLEAASLVWIALRQADNGLTVTAAGGPRASAPQNGVGLPLPETMTGVVDSVIAAGQARLVPGMCRESGGAPETTSAVAPGAPDSAWRHLTGVFPVVSGGRAFGAMLVFAGPAGLSAGALSRCDALVRRLAVAIHLSQETAFLRLQAAAMSVAANAIFITGHDGRIKWVNEAFTKLSGFPSDELRGKTPHILFSGQQDRSVYADLWATIRRGNVWRGEMVERRRDGTLYTVQQTVTPMRGPDDGSQYYVAVHEDISDRKRAEERIRYLSNYDTLTRLPNRTLFRERLNRAVQQARWLGGTVAVLFLDLTQFSRVNDTLGHDVGDQILMTVGSRINAAVADEVDVVARMGGDEFALVQGGHSDAEAAAGLAQRLARIIETPVEMGEHSVSLRATIGIAMYPDDGADPDNLIKNADLAMHRASRSEGEVYCFFSTEMNNEAQVRLGLEADLRRAIEREEFVNYYQPQYDMAGQLVGMEALVRWTHPTQGLVMPGQFISTAEETGLIGALGDIVLRNAAADIMRWRGLGLPVVPVAINISAVQFRDARLVDRILSVLSEHGLAPDALDLELTESILMGEQAGAVGFLNQLAAEGFRIAIDDFGTGYSSLGYLKRFPVHKLKIDQSFVQHLHEDTNDAILVRAIINLGHSLAMTVVAEGVETPEQFAYLRDEGADAVQGYLFSRPVPSEEMERLMRDGVPSLEGKAAPG
ncbi:EAL domain-containing protein [Roseospira marina]|uniref:EAL domain-containing protein n=1 Tax=Roseospira marina TaxID=140057 RepID=A0A5M6IA56_9PROT|nr:EAL domain-containing protein [Roseospira marina]KAA5604609.1 EAL domain-containing protein [Roseospira marina]MBB4315361.1 diguanylate cyclase (GGDEF)-like protein/PAS domain S-box-containing protein [Roseospira marina]MBB5088360.1 diguanylate cyclase (GGDEF)-like protein/PAS domain S-box-containing protein [Roseospira marina]